MPPEFFEYPPTRSNRVKWALHELGVNYTSRVVDLRNRAHHTSDYRSIHPLGHVPAYRTEAYTMHESVAIVLKLLDEHPEGGLAPRPQAPERAAYYQWCVFSCSELDPALFDVMLHAMHLPQAERVPEIARRGRERFAERAAVLCRALDGQAYLLGSTFSGADIAVGYSCDWAAYTGMLADHPALMAYYRRLHERPAFRAVFPDRGLDA